MPGPPPSPLMQGDPASCTQALVPVPVLILIQEFLGNRCEAGGNWAGHPCECRAGARETMGRGGHRESQGKLAERDMGTRARDWEGEGDDEGALWRRTTAGAGEVSPGAAPSQAQASGRASAAIRVVQCPPACETRGPQSTTPGALRPLWAHPGRARWSACRWWRASAAGAPAARRAWPPGSCPCSASPRPAGCVGWEGGKGAGG